MLDGLGLLTGHEHRENGIQRCSLMIYCALSA